MRQYSAINIYFRSIIFAIYSSFSIITYSILVTFSLILPLAYRFKLIRNLLRFYFYMLKVICRIDYKIEGIENIPADQNGIVLSKHQSTWETFFLPMLFREPAFIAKRELLWVPFFGWGLAASEPIFINRQAKASAMQQIIKWGRTYLSQGRWVIFFPEGTRVPWGVVGHYKLGGARLAAETQYPVIPIAHNAGKFWPRRKLIKYPGTITIVIGPMIDTHHKTPEEILELAKQWIEATMFRIDRLVDKPTSQ